MTTRIRTSYLVFFTLAVMMSGATIALASEVTGNLSSDIQSTTQTSGNLDGTVTSNPQTSGNLGGTVTSESSSSGGSSSGGSRSSGSRSSGNTSDAPAGAVLGDAASNLTTPGFPNAGVQPESDSTDTSLWSAVKNFLKNIISF